MVVKTIITSNKRRNRRTRPVAQVVAVVNKPRRKRNRRARNANSKNGKLCPDGDRYIRCVLGVDQGAAKIPDGASHYSGVVEYRSTQTLKPDTDGFLTVCCLPGLPGAMRIISGAGQIPNRNGTTVTVTSANPVGVTVPFPDFYTPNVAANQNLPNGSAGIQQARVVNYSMEVVQVGAVLSQQGNATTARIPYNLKDTIPQAFDSTGAGAVSAGLTFTSLAGSQMFVGLEDMMTLSFSNVSTFPNSKMCSATEACKLSGIPTHSEYTPTRVHNVGTNNSVTPTAVCVHDGMPFCSRLATSWLSATVAAGGAADSNVMFPILPITTDINYAGDFWTATDCEALIWAGSNLGTTTLFEFRVSMCVEFVVDHSSSLYRPIITPPAQRDDMAIAVVEEVARIMPSSVSSSGGAGGWWGALTSAVTGVGDLVSGLGIPIVSPLAGVASKLLRNLGLA